MRQSLSTQLRAAVLLVLLMANSLACLGDNASTPTADLVLTNGRIYTLDSEAPWAEALAVKNGEILAVGKRKDVEGYVGANTRVSDLGKRFVMPGINDAHIHSLWGGIKQLFECSFPFSASPEDIAGTLSTCIEENPEADWIIGGQWASEFFNRFTLPGSPREWLDQLSKTHAIALSDDSGHNHWLNTRAMELLGIRADSPDPEGGTILRDKNGAPNGILLESGAFQILERLPPYTDQQNHQGALAGIATLNRVGITAFKEAMADIRTIRTYHALDTKGEMNSRVVTCHHLPQRAHPGPRDFSPIIAQLASFDTDRLKNHCVKYFLDGVPTAARTAAMLAPYLPGPGDHNESTSGELLEDPEMLAREVTALDALGITVKMHAAGDRAIRVALDAIEAARKDNGQDGPWHELAHAELIDKADLPRFARLNAVADMSPAIWFPSPITESVVNTVGARSDSFFPFRSLLDSGSPVVAGSDWPAAVPSPSPWPGIEAMVSRRNPMGTGGETLAANEAISLEEALEIVTLNGARALGLEEITGSLKTGKSADFIVLDRNLLETPVEMISETQVLETWVEGEKIYKR